MRLRGCTLPFKLWRIRAYSDGVARKTCAHASQAHGLTDVIGLGLVAAAALLFLAQVSYDPNDLPANRMPPNPTAQNWIGPAGAHLAYGLFWLFGVGAFGLPILLGFFGLAPLVQALAPVRRRWPWAVVLLLCIAGLFDLYAGPFQRLSHNLNLGGLTGGQVGRQLNSLAFGRLSGLGATIVFGTLYLISLIYLTNFQLVSWIRSLFTRPPTPWPPTEPMDEKTLARRARELEKEARKLQEEMARSGLGVDLQPVPPPTVRDLSVPTPRFARTTLPRATEAPAARPSPEAEVITAREIAAATTAQVLGQPEPKPTAAAPATAADASASTAPVEKPESAPASTEAASAQSAPASPAPQIIDQSGAAAAKPARRPKPITVASTPKIGNYQLPPLDLLALPDPNVRPTETREELMANARLMQQTLAQFDIDVALGDITKGPTITRYELHPAPGVKLERITALANNIAAALKAERIHILAPVPGKSSVGIEVPNRVKTKVIMRDLLESEEWQQTKARIPLALGKDVYGHPIIADLAEMPHLLIAGSTGSGKSVCINAIITSLLYRFPPDQLRFVMIDPKVVELQQYNQLPHLVVPVVTDPKKVILALRWVINEMEKRYQIFAKVGVRNIKSFNERPRGRPSRSTQGELPLTTRKEKVEVDSNGFAVQVDEEIVVPEDEDIIIPDKLAYIVVVIDELADLMLVAPADVEMAIARITQMARAAGIHCIIATQRPSVDVITGVIKANIPARIAFQVASKVDSRTILDAMGADKLLGKGDMLYLPPGSAKLIRAQGALITDQEIQAIVEFIARQGKPSYEMDIHQQLCRPDTGSGTDSTSDEDEELIQQCIEVIRSEQKASVSLLQRRLRLGYTRAARIMDELEKRGIVGPSKGAEPRDILIDLDAPGRGSTANSPSTAAPAPEKKAG
jgi:S-DNA-T family DNA segregation ATPase FtsK/SpoIIIE